MPGHKFPKAFVAFEVEEWWIPILERMCGIKVMYVTAEQFEAIKNGAKDENEKV